MSPAACVVFVTALLISTAFTRSIGQNRVAGGEVTGIEKVPYQLSLTKANVHACGAAIIDNYWAVTAARCVHGVPSTSVRLRAGSSSSASGGTLYETSKIVIHESYISGKNDNDIALIKVKTPFALGKPGINNITLPLNNENVPDGQDVVLSGYGKISASAPTSPEKLHQVTLKTIKNDVCKTAQTGLTNSMICAGFTTGGRDACDGDTGSPLALKGKLVGIVSWGFSCGKTGNPGVYTKVSSYISWINSNAGT